MNREEIGSSYRLGVAKMMKRGAMEAHPENKEFAEDMFMLGLLHDIGRDSSKNDEEVATISGKILKRNKYKYWKEVYWQLQYDIRYKSEALELLNTSIMITTKCGRVTTAYDTLMSVESKYGKSSLEYINYRKLARKLNLIQDRF